MVNAFHVGIVFLDAGRFYNIFSHLSFFFSFFLFLSFFSCLLSRQMCHGWIVDIIQTTHLSYYARRRISPFLENIIFFILDVFIFTFGSNPLLSLIVPQTLVLYQRSRRRCSIAIIILVHMVPYAKIGSKD